MSAHQDHIQGWGTPCLLSSALKSSTGKQFCHESGTCNKWWPVSETMLFKANTSQKTNNNLGSFVDKYNVTFFLLLFVLDEGQLCQHNSSNNNETKTRKTISATPTTAHCFACCVQILTPCVFWISTANSLKTIWPPSPKTAHYPSLKERMQKVVAANYRPGKDDQVWQQIER